MHPVWRCWYIIQAGQILLLSPPVICCPGFHLLLFNTSVSWWLCSLCYGDFLGHWFALPKTRSEICSWHCPPNLSAEHTLESHQHKPQELVGHTSPHGKACTLITAALAGLEQNLFLASAAEGRLSQQGPLTSLPADHYHKDSSIGNTQVPCSSAAWILKTLAQFRLNIEKFKGKIQGKTKEIKRQCWELSSLSICNMHRRLSLPWVKRRNNYLVFIF